MKIVKLDEKDQVSLRSSFQSAKPFRHLVIDNFYKEDVLENLLNDFPDIDDERWFRFREKVGKFDNIFEKKMNAISKPEDLPAFSLCFLSLLNSLDFCEVLENITGIEGIQPDPHWHYTGLRINDPGACQLIHSDAVFHPHLKKRKILTVMSYLTKNWKEEDEGCLEIWNDEMTECAHSIAPVFNRVLIFENTETSYHGVPKNNHRRKAVTMSYLLDEKEEKRWRALFVKRPEDKLKDDFDLIANERSILRDTK